MTLIFPVTCEMFSFPGKFNFDVHEILCNLVTHILELEEQNNNQFESDSHHEENWRS
jgi:hypothetical protein